MNEVCLQQNSVRPPLDSIGLPVCEVRTRLKALAEKSWAHEPSARLMMAELRDELKALLDDNRAWRAAASLVPVGDFSGDFHRFKLRFILRLGGSIRFALRVVLNESFWV